MNNLDVKKLGQVFTQKHTVDLLLSLRKKFGSVLEPSCGDGSISNNINNCIALEIDNLIKPNYAKNMDFFKYSIDYKFNTIIGNPPYIKYKDIIPSTKILLQYNYSNLFNKKSNLYLFFIYKSILHLENDGELIFICPRDFFNATSSIKLNNYIFNMGSITDIIDFGDEKIFDGFSPNCIIFRFEKNNFIRKTNYFIAKLKSNKIILQSSNQLDFKNINGRLVFNNDSNKILFKDIFFVKVGGVSGADEIFKNNNGNKEFVVSETVKTKKTQIYFYNIESPDLLLFKPKLLNRKIKKFNKDNWYMWGRNIFESNEKRIYVNCKTRIQNPFFYNECLNFDGSILGIFPKNQNLNIQELIKDLNMINWKEMGFKCNDRFIFSQNSLENCLLPSNFEKYLIK